MTKIAALFKTTNTPLSPQDTRILHLLLAVLGLFVLLPSAAFGQPGQWTLQPTHPTPRGTTGMAFDSGRGVTVMFGGAEVKYEK